MGQLSLEDVSMKPLSLSKIAIATSTFTFATLLSFGWCEQSGVSLSVESAQARVGRPLTPVSVAGVARRQNRRAAYGYGYGAAELPTPRPEAGRQQPAESAPQSVVGEK